MSLYKTNIIELISKSGALALVLNFCMPWANAAPGQLSDVPLFLGSSVQPNILFMIDDSGSMRRTVLKSSASEAAYERQFFQGQTYFGDFNPIDVYPDADDPETLLESCAGYNVMYYNPESEYTPWVGDNSSGVAFQDQSPSFANSNPYRPNWGSWNLLGYSGGVPAGYIRWDDDNGNGEFDVGECGDSPQIGNDPRDTEVDYAGHFVSIHTMSAEEQVNFANWFSYYRQRDYVVKRAVSEIINGGSSRMGLATLNNSNNVGTPILDVDDITTPVNNNARINKNVLMHRLFNIATNGDTPLRRSLERAGRYFERGIDPGSRLFGNSPNPISPILPESEGGACQQNFTVLLSDGFWNGGEPSIGNTDIGSNSEFDGGSYADPHSNTLADVAMYYYERDLAGDLDNVVPVTEGVDNNEAQHMVTFTVAFGVSGDVEANPVDEDAAFNWPLPVDGQSSTIDDMRHAAWNGRGEFLSARDPQQLIEALSRSVDVIEGRNSSASAVAFNTTSVTVDTFVYQARFDAQDWSGSLHAFRFNDEGVGEVVWNAADGLNDSAFDWQGRAVFTSRTDISLGVPFEFPTDYNLRLENTNPENFTEGLSNLQIQDLLVGAPEPEAGETFVEADFIDANVDYGTQLVNYLKGDFSNEGVGLNFRSRNGHRLGDIVHSSPEYVGKPSEAYPNLIEGGEHPYFEFVSNNSERTPVVYIGGNDGMLHAFGADDGEDGGLELFAYIPGILFDDGHNSGLHNLMQRNYEHQPYVDGSPVSRDVFVDGEWRTYLVGGLRAGGRGIYVLDVTDPDNYRVANEASARRLVKAEFTGDPDLGFTFSRPQVAKLNNGRWAAIFGNGYNSDGDGTAKLFVMYLDGDSSQSASVLRFETGVGSVVNGNCLTFGSDCNGMSSPTLVDLNGDFRVDRVYAGDLHGNLWAFDLSSEDADEWGSAFGAGTSASPLFSACSGACGALTRQPITAKPVVAAHPQVIGSQTAPNLMVMFGTGQFLANGDRDDTSLQSFYGVWDSGSPRGDLIRGDLVEQEIVTADSVRAGARGLTSNTVNYASGDVFGWHIDLTEGERVVVDPIVSDNFVFFNTTIPDDEECSAGGSGFLMVADLATGGMPSSRVFVGDANGEIDGVVAGLAMDSIPGGSVIIGDQIVVSNSRGEIEEFEYQRGSNNSSRRASWSIIK